jgi:HD-like signal output (HDOD) protein
MMKECEHTGESLSARERIAFGFSHSELGARLLDRWGVPEEVVLPVLGHNDSGGTEESQRYVAITNLASRLAAYIEQKNPATPFVEEPGVKPLAEFLGLENGAIAEWEQAVRKKLKNLPGLMMACSDSSCL